MNTDDLRHLAKTTLSREEDDLVCAAADLIDELRATLMRQMEMYWATTGLLRAERDDYKREVAGLDDLLLDRQEVSAEIGRHHADFAEIRRIAHDQDMRSETAIRLIRNIVG